VATSAPPPADPGDPTGLRLAISTEFDAGSQGAANPQVKDLVGKIERAAGAIDAIPRPDPAGLAGLSKEMGEHLDALEDLLEALALSAGPSGAG
jgi:hypothetical protein